MRPQENKNLHVKLPKVATWLKWSEFHVLGNQTNILCMII